MFRNLRPYYNGYHGSMAYRGNLDHFPGPTHFSPLSDITGTFFGETLNNTRGDGFINNRGLGQVQSLYLVRNSNPPTRTSSLHMSGIAESTSGSVTVESHSVLRERVRPRETYLNTSLVAGSGAIGENINRNGVVLNSNRNYVDGTQMEMNNYISLGYGGMERSISMSSPNLDYATGNSSGNRRGNRSLFGSTELGENNRNLINRSRSFADRILEQFDTIEREHHDLSERIQRSQSLYEQIQRNSEEINRILGSFSERRISQRSHTRENYNNNDEISLRSQSVMFGTNTPTPYNRSDRMTTHTRREEGERIRNSNSHYRDVNYHSNEGGHVLRGNPLLPFEQNVPRGTGERRGNRQVTYSSDIESEIDDDVMEVSQVDEELEDYISRRNLEIRNRSLIIEREEVIFEYSDDLDDDNESSMGDLGDGDHHQNNFSEYNSDYNPDDLELEVSFDSLNEVEYERDENSHSREHRDVTTNATNVERHGLQIGTALLEGRQLASPEGSLDTPLSQTGSRDDTFASFGSIRRRNRPCVPLEIQDSLPVSRYDEQKSRNLDEDKKTCLICLESFKDKQEILWLPCTHCFCKDCIVSWFNRGNSCPICKDDVLAHFAYQ